MILAKAFIFTLHRCLDHPLGYQQRSEIICVTCAPIIAVLLSGCIYAAYKCIWYHVPLTNTWHWSLICIFMLLSALLLWNGGDKCIKLWCIFTSLFFLLLLLILSGPCLLLCYFSSPCIFRLFSALRFQFLNHHYFYLIKNKQTNTELL